MTDAKRLRIVSPAMPSIVPSRKARRTRKVIPAPEWLVRRMETLRRLPPPSLNEVAVHLKASAESRKKLNARRRV